MWGSEILGLQGFRKSAGEFWGMSEKKGLKAALEWRDADRGAYRVSKAEKSQG
jgi:hypothetical protein